MAYAPLAHSPFRFFALMGMMFSAVGAGLLFLLAWVAESGAFENSEPSEEPGEWFMLGAALGFIGACVSIYGLAARSPLVTRVGAIGQGAGAVLVVVLIETSSERRGDEFELLFPLAMVIVLDVFVVLWAVHLRRTVSRSATG